MEERGIRQTTEAKYRGLLDRHILPKFGSVQLGRISTPEIRAWHNALATVHPDTAAQAYRLLAAIFKTAVDDNRIPRSSCRVKGASYYRNPERPVATHEEIVAAVAATTEEYRLAIILAVWCQLRPQEILGLQRQHIDLNQGQLTIKQTMTAGNGKMVDGPPKTEAGIRVLHIPEHVLPHLTDHLERFVADQADSWLFPATTGSCLSTRTLQRQWVKAREAIGRPELRLYDMRHTGLTMVASAGASLAEIMRRGGHASPAAALKYQHATDGRDKIIAAGLSNLALNLQLPDSEKMGHAGGTDTPEVTSPDEDEVSALTAAAEPTTPEQPAPLLNLTPVWPGGGHAAVVNLNQEIADFLGEVDRARESETEQPQRDSNPCRHLERVVSLASRRWGRAEVSVRSPPVLGGKDSNPQ